jgi:hypothetical protein
MTRVQRGRANRLDPALTEGVRAMAARAKAAKLSMPRSAGSARHALAVIERTAERTLVDPGQGRYQSLGWMQPRPADQAQSPDDWLEGSYGVLARLPLHSAHPRPV